MVLFFLEIKFLYLILLKDLPNELLQKNLEKQEKRLQSCRIFRTIVNHNGKPQKREISRKWQTKHFSVFFPSSLFRDSDIIILLIFFSSNYSLTVILFLLLFVFHKKEYKDSIIIGSIFKFPYTSKDNPENPKQVGKTSWQLPGSTIPPYSSSWYSKINMINKSYSRQTKNN